MNPKTIEKIAEVLEGYNGFYIHKYNKEALAKICAIVDKEREGEVVLCSGRVDFAGWTECNGPNSGGKQIGKKGRLIFVPDQEEK
jgi:hypothetical protein